MSDENIEKTDVLTEAIPSTVVQDASIEMRRILSQPTRMSTSSSSVAAAVSASSKYWAIIVINLISLVWVMALKYYPIYQQFTLVDEYTLKSIIEWIDKYTYPTLLSSTLVLVVISMLGKNSGVRDGQSSQPVLGTSMSGFVASMYIALPFLTAISWHIDRVRFGFAPLIIGFVGIVVWLVLIFANLVYLTKRSLASRNDFGIVVNFAFLIVLITQLTYLGLSSWLIWRLFMNFKLLF